MRIGLLGPLEVHTDTGTPVDIGGTRLRTLLTLLALDAGRVVSTGRLVEEIWDGHAPAGAGNALQALVSRLRRRLPPGAVESHPTGYRLAVPPEAVDTHRFEQLVTEGRKAVRDDPRYAAAALTEALTLWRGSPAADLTDTSLPAAEAARLNEL